MITSGLKPTRYDPRDFDYLKTKKLGAITPEFPKEYSVEAGLWTPNQNEGYPPLNVPPMPFGCTNYTQCDLCADEDQTLYDPNYLESLTHANANGGSDLRVVLKAVTKSGVRDAKGTIHTDHQAFFNIKASGAIDPFDAARLAMLSASNEKRGVSVGTPWYPDFNVTDNGILPVPQDWTPPQVWHNYAVKGWKEINGQTYLIVKPWLGEFWADKGFCYMSRTIFNALMNISGAAMFTIDRDLPGEVQTVDYDVVAAIVAFVRRLFFGL